MKIRLADYGLLMVLAPITLVFGSWGMNSLHEQGVSTAKISTASDTKIQHIKNSRSDIDNGVNWTLGLKFDKGKKVGEFLTSPKKGVLLPRTVVVVALVGESSHPDQVLSLNPKSGEILNISSIKQVNQIREKK